MSQAQAHQAQAQEDDKNDGNGNAATTPLSLSKEYAGVVRALDAIETAERIRFLPHLVERRQEPDPARQQQQPSSCVKMNHNADDHVSLQHRNLRVFSIELLLPMLQSPPSLLLSQLTTLDVSNNELIDLPGLCKCSYVLGH